MQYGNILQIMNGALGWEAVYASRTKSNKANFYKKAVNFWALVEIIIPGSNIGSAVVGMVISDNTSSPALVLADRAGDFIGYNYPGCEVNWQFEADRFVKNSLNT